MMDIFIKSASFQQNDEYIHQIFLKDSIEKSCGLKSAAAFDDH